MEALWQAIRRAMDTGEWRPRRGRLCDWCDHRELCPEFGGTPPPLPVAGGGERSAAELVEEPAGAARERDDL